MLSCPVCHSEIEKGAIRRGGFRCPACKERIRLRKAGTVEIAAIILLGFLVAYLVGVRGIELVFGGVILSFVVGTAYGFGLGLSPKLEKAEHDSTYIILPPGGK
jgi:hypothetical protein